MLSVSVKVSRTKSVSGGPLGEAELEGERELDGEREREVLLLGLRDGEGETDGEGELEGLSDEEGDSDALTLLEGLTLEDGETLGLGLRLGLIEDEGDPAASPLTLSSSIAPATVGLAVERVNEALPLVPPALKDWSAQVTPLPSLRSTHGAGEV